jgi:hypothetical protein
MVNSDCGGHLVTGLGEEPLELQSGSGIASFFLTLFRYIGHHLDCSSRGFFMPAFRD